MKKGEMTMWGIIFGAAAILLFLAMINLFRCMRRFERIKALDANVKKLSWLIAAFIVFLLAATLMYFINLYAAAFVLIHLAVFFCISDLIFMIVRAASGKEISKDINNWVAILLCLIYLGIGWYNAHHVTRTAYELTTSKDIGSIRLVVIADSHLGIPMSGEKFAGEMKKIEKENADFLLIAGDFVDDDSSRADMEEACAALGSLNMPKVYVFGNHDKGYRPAGRDFTYDDLRAELGKNGVEVLEDGKSVHVTGGKGSITLVGRKDKSASERQPVSELCKGIDMENSYVIVLDHQPNDYAAEAEAGADLVLSGHTHGGHFFPAGPIGELIGANDRTYGHEKRGNTDFIVTSGIAEWAIPFKTGAFSEYAVIDITQ